MTEVTVVIQRARSGAITDPALRRSLSKGRIAAVPAGDDALSAIADNYDAPRPEARAALRYFGQTGDRPDTWIAAADPIHFETRMRDIVVRTVATPDSEDVSRIFDSLERELANGVRFECHASLGYLVSRDAMASAPDDGSANEGRPPALPAVGDTDHYQRLMGEIQMLLHDHEVNVERSAISLPAINALWIWGGGRLPPPVSVHLPELFAEDPSWSGMWRNCDAGADAWPGSIEACIDTARGSFVAVPPDQSSAEEALRGAFAALGRGQVTALHVRSTDGVHALLRRRDRLRVWRRTSPCLEVATDG